MNLNYTCYKVVTGNRFLCTIFLTYDYCNWVKCYQLIEWCCEWVSMWSQWLLNYHFWVAKDDVEDNINSRRSLQMVCRLPRNRWCSVLARWSSGSRRLPTASLASGFPQSTHQRWKPAFVYVFLVQSDRQVFICGLLLCSIIINLMNYMSLLRKVVKSK